MTTTDICEGAPKRARMFREEFAFMKYIEIGKSGIHASNLAMGCMRMNGQTVREAEKIIRLAMEEGINFFDHADIYGQGECEKIFGAAVGLMGNSLREKMIIQGKCGITRGERYGYYDFSKEHILQAADGILMRLQMEYLDFLVLHRPDTLMDPAEVAEAFEILHKAGKVRHFGVSNHRPQQVELLQKYVPFKLEVNQLQLSIPHCLMIDSGMTANMDMLQGYDRDGSVLEYSRLHDMTIQAWSPFQGTAGSYRGPFLGNMEDFGPLNTEIRRLAEKYEVTDTAVAVAWITRHPANIQVLLGSMNPQRIKDACKGSELPLTREEWYGLYQASGKVLP